MENKINMLVEYRDSILLAEIGALIHDLGKLSEGFVRSKCAEESGNWIHHTAIIEYDVYGNIPHAEKAKQILEGIEIQLNKFTIRLYDFVLGHHKKLWNKKEVWNKPENFEYDYNKRKYYENNIFLKFIIASDTFDSEEDKSYSKDPQSIRGVYKSTSFGFENELIEIDNLIEERMKIYKILIDWLTTCDFDKIVSKRRECMNKIRESFSKALGETRRSANDVSLWDHSYMTATIMKALVAYHVLDSSFIVSSKKEITEKKPFKIFAVGWDFFDFINQSHKIPDVVGRIKILEKIKEEIKRIVEEECALGNSIYEDDFGVYFLIPSIINDEDLKDVKEKIFDVFNKEVNGILLPVFHIKGFKQNEFRIGQLLTRAIKSIREKISQHEVDLIKVPAWVESWESSAKLPKDKLICNVCSKGYYCKGNDEEICNVCDTLRKLGRKSKPPQTVFIDEISWNPKTKQYENVCLLVAKFDLDEWLSGKFVQSLFIRNPKKHYDDISWGCGKTISGLAKLLGGTLRDKIRSNTWDKEAEKNVYDAVRSFLLNKVSILKGKSIESIARDVVKLIEKEHKSGKALRDIIRQEYSEYFITKTIFNFEYLDDLTILKSPSPSRLMRIWNNTQEFFEDLSKQICSRVPVTSECKIVLKNSISNLTPNMAYIFEIEGKEIGEIISLEETSEELCVITPHSNEYLLKNKNELKGKEIVLKHSDSRKVIARGVIKEIKENSRVVRAYRVISTSPAMFMTIIPASVSLDIVKMIKEEYMKHFGKVFGKLPLHIGIIYFKRKMPIFTVLDSTNRMINEFERLNNGEEVYIIENLRDTDDHIKLELNKEDKESFRYEVKIPYRLGDGNVDYYHPYLRVKESSDGIIEIKVDNETFIQKHISKIKKGDKTSYKIIMKKYYFDFEFLDSNIRRFDIGKKRRHWLLKESENNPKPYLLWDIDKFDKLLDIIKKYSFSNTQVMNLFELLVSKIEGWKLYEIEKLKSNKEFERFVENSILDVPLRLKRKISKEDFEFLKETILTGMFFDFVDLWHTILKLNFKENNT